MARKSILRLARYAPKDGRVFISVERPPFETKTFYFTVRWDAKCGGFRTYPQGHCCYFSHFIDCDDLPKPPLNPKSFRESLDGAHHALQYLVDERDALAAEVLALRERESRLVEATEFAICRAETLCDETWNGDARDFKRSMIGIFAEYRAALSEIQEGGE